MNKVFIERFLMSENFPVRILNLFDLIFQTFLGKLYDQICQVYYYIHWLLIISIIVYLNVQVNEILTREMVRTVFQCISNELIQT